MLAPVLCRLMKFHENDRVRTRFGCGVLTALAPTLTVELDSGAVFYPQAGFFMPEFQAVTESEFPPGVEVLICRNSKDNEVHEQLHGVVVSYCAKTREYSIRLRAMVNGQMNTAVVGKNEVKLASTTRVQSSFGRGTIQSYRTQGNIYVVALDCSATAFLKENDVKPLDSRLFNKLPKPLSSSEIFEKSNGKLTMQQAEKAAEYGLRTYKSIQEIFESSKSTSVANKIFLDIGLQNSKSNLKRLCNETVLSKLKDIETKGKSEFKNLLKIFDGIKQRCVENSNDPESLSSNSTELTSTLKQALTEIKELPESQDLSREIESAIKEIATGKEGKIATMKILAILDENTAKYRAQLSSLDQESVFGTIHASISSASIDIDNALQKGESFQNLLEKISADHIGMSSVAYLDPMVLFSKVESSLPEIAEKAEVLIENGEKILNEVQKSENGKRMINSARKYINSIQESKDYDNNIKSMIASVNVQDLTELGTSLASSSSARQEFVNKVKNQCLNFLMAVLPSIKVEPITGVKDEIEYSIENLDLSNFTVKKENVTVKLGVVGSEEVFSVYIHDVSATVKGFNWSFVQNYFPYLNGGGLANASFCGGYICVSFRAESEENGFVFQPLLTLGGVTIDIEDDLNIQIQGSWFSAVYNVLVNLFSDLIHDSLISTLESNLINHTAPFLSNLNGVLNSSSYIWPLLLKVSQLNVSDLPPAGCWRGAKIVEFYNPQIEKEIKYSNGLALPFTLEKHTRSRLPVVKNEYDPEKLKLSNYPPIGSFLIAINGVSTLELTVEEVNGYLSNFVDSIVVRFSIRLPETEQSKRKKRRKLRKRVEYKTVVFHEGPLGLKLRPRPLADSGAVVGGFLKLKDGRLGPAEESGSIYAGNLVIKVNEFYVLGLPFAEVLSCLKECQRPLTIVFASNSDGIVKLNKWPPRIVLSNYINSGNGKEQEIYKYVVINGFQGMLSPVVERLKQNNVGIGSKIVKIQNQSMADPEQKSFLEVMETIKNTINQQLDFFEMTFEIVSQRSSVAEIMNCVSIQVRQEEYTAMDIEFGMDAFGNTVIKQFLSHEGPAEVNSQLYCGLAILQVCGHTLSEEETTSEAVYEKIQAVQSPPYSLTVRDLDVYHELLHSEI